MKKENIDPTITIQNNINFRLTNPNKGKLKSNSLYSAFTKTKLSSIPINNEIFIFDKTFETEKQFFKKIKKILSNKSKKESKKLNEKKSNNSSSKKKINNKKIIKISNLNTNNKKIIIKSNSSPEIINTNDYSSNFKSNTKYNDNKELFLSKYSPGPGQYSSDYLTFTNNNNLRYKSLFKGSRINNNNLNKKIIPGPGSYNITTSILYKNSPIPNLNLKEVRFKKEKFDNIGPGYYFRNENEKIKKKENSISFLNSLNKEKELRNKIKSFKLIKKYLGLENKYEVPGPGKYNFKSIFSKYNQDSNFLNNKKISHLNIFGYDGNKTNLISDNVRKLYNDALNKELLKLSNLHEIITDKNKKDKNKKSNNNIKGISSPFISTTKKFISYNNNHVPGPCYYYN
jgi:hypothetical protein